MHYLICKDDLQISELHQRFKLGVSVCRLKRRGMVLPVYVRGHRDPLLSVAMALTHKSRRLI